MPIRLNITPRRYFPERVDNTYPLSVQRTLSFRTRRGLNHNPHTIPRRVGYCFVVNVPLVQPLSIVAWRKAEATLYPEISVQPPCANPNVHSVPLATAFCRFPFLSWDSRPFASTQQHCWCGLLSGDALGHYFSSFPLSPLPSSFSPPRCSFPPSKSPNLGLSQIRV